MPTFDHYLPVLVVEDDDESRRLLVGILQSEGYQTIGAANASQARRRLTEHTFAAGLIDVRMPGESGIDLLKFVRTNYIDVAAIMVTASDDRQMVDTAFETGAYGYVVKPYRISELLINLSNALHRRAVEIQSRSYIRELEEKVLDRTRLLRETLAPLGDSRLPVVSAEEMIVRLSEAVTVRDEETGSHIRRMSESTAYLADRAGVNGASHEEIRLASALHDVGKIGIPDAILQKPGPLSTEERLVMQRHTIIGHKLLSDSQSPLLQLGASIALTHHEKWDGSGYPAGLAGDAIPHLGRVAAVADVFDALMSNRVYRKAMEIEEALDTMKRGRGVHFDPDVFDTFVESIDQMLLVRKVHPDGPSGDQAEGDL